LKDVVEKIVNEIKRIHHGEFGVSFGEIVLGQGDLAFNFENKLSLIRGELIGDLTGKELNQIIE